jgi:methyltransferase-like protein/2-polyprenyl-3-methyl-5-hydroxy-6-metoxy-1,4-benzoquinol methylase
LTSAASPRERANEELLRSYDEVRYRSVAHRQTDPDRLATIARLHGIVTAPLERCRVLEIGCAVGGNLASIAMTMPEAQLVGIDLSGSQIEQGRAAMAAAGVDNVKLSVLDLVDVGTSLGTFDYIVAHGVFSWISADAQDELLALFARCLAPNGVAYVSYNTKPGWHQLSALRDAMLFDGRDVKVPRERIRRAREYLAWLRKSIPQGGAYGPQFIEELTAVEAAADEILLHEYLGPFNLPIHFHKLIARASRFGLSYLCDAEPALSADHSLAPAADGARQRSPNELVFAEQHFDFLTNRRFRRTLLCRRGAPLTRTIDFRLVDTMFVSLDGRAALDEAPGAGTDPRSTEPLTLRTADNELTTDDPVMKAALRHLASLSPRAIPFAELLEAVRARLGPSPDADHEAHELRESIVGAFLSTIGTVTLRTHPSPCVNEPSERPIASRWARYLAAEESRVPNLDHGMVRVDPMIGWLLPLLDGTRDRAALDAELAAKIERGEVVLRTPDGRPGKPAPGAMEGALRMLARSALLVG